MVEEAKKNPYTEVGKEVCPSHICTVWDKVSEFIQIQLSSGRGVRIPGLVTFNYKIFTTDINQKQVVVQRIPYMLISEDLVKKYALKSKRPAFVFDVRQQHRL
jgi:single-stranded DNA-binding protein